MQIGAPDPVISNPQYGNPEAINEGLRHGFVNQGMVGVVWRGVWCGAVRCDVKLV